MKKNLLATSALVAAGALVSSGAFAQAKPIEIKVGGYYEQWIGFGSQDSTAFTGEDVQDFDVQEDGEIHFSGSTTLDNGLTFGVNVQLETQVQGDQIDENYLFIRGDFGEIVLGSENGAAYAMGYGIVSNGTGIDSGDGCNWGAGGFASGCFELATTQGNFARRDNDSNKIRYISPRFSGFQIGASYAPEATQDDDGFPTEGTNGPGAGRNEEGVFAVAANYDNKFGDVRVRVSGGYQLFSDSNGANSNNDGYAFGTGLRVGFGGFTVSAGYHLQNDRSTTIDEVQTFGGGLAYAQGPIGVSLAAVYGNADGTTGSPDDEQLMVELGGKYKLGPGVEAKGSIFYNDRERGGSDTNGFAVVGGIRLAF